MPAARAPKSSRSWLWISGGVLFFLIALVVALRDKGDSPVVDSASKLEVPGRPNGSKSSALGTDEEQGRSNERRPRGGSKRTSDDEGDLGQRFPMVDVILDDDALSPVETARRLMEIAMKEEISDAERQEALAHGLNLDFKSFLAAAENPSLPVPMAERYLDALLNHNEEPKEQIHGCLALMGHDNEGIRTDAMHQLAFLIENESLESSPAELRQAAAAFLEKLAAAPPETPTEEPAEEPADSDPAMPDEPPSGE